MARMRLMRDRATGTLVAVCVYCDAKAAADPLQTQTCACRDQVVERPAPEVRDDTRKAAA